MAVELLRHSLSSCRGLETISASFRQGGGKGGAFEVLQGNLDILTLLAAYLLQPPEKVDDRFRTEFSGQCIRLEDRRRTAVLDVRASINFRRHIIAAGARAVHSGFSRWTTRCNGPSFAIGVIPNAAWPDLEKDSSMDWPFVGSGFGQGFGLVKRRGSFFVARGARGRLGGGRFEGAQWDDYPVPDREVSAEGLADVKEFSVVLDLERARVYFEAEGRELPGSSFEDINTKSGYRFIASVPERGVSVTLVDA